MATNNNQEMNNKKARIGRGWCLTINNPKIPGDAYLEQWLADGVIVFGCGQLEEAPETGTKHLQMYIVTKANEKNPKGFSRKWVSDNIHSKAYITNRDGTHEEARDYCTLPEYKGKVKIVHAGPWTVGAWDGAHELTPSERKKGSTKGGEKVKLNWETMLSEIKAGQSDKYLMEKYPHMFLTSHKAVEKARLVYSTEHSRRQPDVIVFYGPTGTGKSHRANKIMMNNGGGKVFTKGNHGNFWADGYDPMRHDVVWFDEFDGSWFSYKQLLRICDKWPFDMETKGGTVGFNPKIIIFTSSKHPKEWYSIEAVPDTSELMRRLSGKHGCIKQLQNKIEEPTESGRDLIDRLDELSLPPPLAAEVVAITKFMNTNPIPVGVDEIPLSQARRMKFVNQDDFDRDFPKIDLTAYEDIDDDVDDKHPTPPETASQEMFADMCNCEICGNNIRDGCDCFDEYASGDRDDGTDSIEGDGYIDEDFDALREAQQVSLADRNEAQLLARQNAITAQSTSDMTPKTSAPSVPNAPRKRAAELTFEPPPKAPASEFKKYKQVPGQSRLAMAPWHTRHDDDE